MSDLFFGGEGDFLASSRTKNMETPKETPSHGNTVKRPQYGLKPENCNLVATTSTPNSSSDACLKVDTDVSATVHAMTVDVCLPAADLIARCPRPVNRNRDSARNVGGEHICAKPSGVDMRHQDLRHGAPLAFAVALDQRLRQRWPTLHLNAVKKANVRPSNQSSWWPPRNSSFTAFATLAIGHYMRNPGCIIAHTPRVQ